MHTSIHTYTHTYIHTYIQGYFCKKNRCQYALSEFRHSAQKNFTLQVSKKLMTFFCFFTKYFIYYPSLFNISYLTLDFSFHPLLIYVKKLFSHFKKGVGTQVTFPFKIYIKIFFFSSKKVLVCRTISKMPCMHTYIHTYIHVYIP